MVKKLPIPNDITTKALGIGLNMPPRQKGY
jgi:hypothetical protein